MSVSEKLTSILNSRAAIKSAIENKGVTVGEAPLSSYAECINSIQTGGGGASTSTALFLPFNNSFAVTGDNKYLVARGEQRAEMDFEYYGWGGNFTEDANFGHVLTFPNQDEGE